MPLKQQKANQTKNFEVAKINKSEAQVEDSFKKLCFEQQSLRFRILSFKNMHSRGAYDKFPDIFSMGTFIDSTQMKL